jgi:hypothetical protein
LTSSRSCSGWYLELGTLGAGGDGVSILILLLRFLTVPMPPVVASAAAVVDADALRDARAQMAAIEGAPEKIRTFMRGAQDGPVRLSCVQQRLAEAQVHVMLARDEMQTLAEPGPGRAHASADDRAHARTRLRLLAQRTQEVEHAARACIDDELSTISATKYETEVPAAVERVGDVTSAPLPALRDERPPER